MNGLVLDLVDLLRQHLTTVEDIFIVGTDDCLTKNIKVAVRTRNWKSILYYLQRYDYNDKVVLKMYCAACESGYIDWMGWSLFMRDNMFLPIPYEEPFRHLRARYTIKYLAKGSHYGLLDSYIKTIDSKLDDYDRFKLASSVAEGLIINGDIDNHSLVYKYYIDKSIYEEVGCTYKIFKHQRIKLMEYELPWATCVRGLLRAGRYSILDENGWNLIKGNSQLIYLLYRYGSDDDLSSYELFNKNYINTDSLKGMIDSGRIERVKKCLSEQPNLDKMVISRAIVETDNVDLFRYYFFRGGVDLVEDTLKSIVGLIVRNEALCILEYFRTDVPHMMRHCRDYVDQVGVNNVNRKVVAVLNNYIKVS